MGRAETLTSSESTAMLKATGGKVSSSTFDAVEFEGEFDGRTVCSADRRPRNQQCAGHVKEKPTESFWSRLLAR